jgi:hypothetical protein
MNFEKTCFIMEHSGTLKGATTHLLIDTPLSPILYTTNNISMLIL